MSITQSTLKKKTSDGSSGEGFGTTYYGFADYDGSTTHIAVVRHKNDPNKTWVYQLDPEYIEYALFLLSNLLTLHFGIGYEIAVHVQPPAIVV